MDSLILLSVMLGTLILGAMSPGPSFIIVSKAAVNVSRRAAVATAMGLGLGSLVFSILVLVGLHTILTHVPPLYGLLKVVGGLYLLHLAFRMYRGANEPVEEHSLTPPCHSSHKHIVLGLLTQVSNPKTALFYSSVFAAVLPSGIPVIIYWLLPPLAFAIETSWYGLVAITLSSAKPKALYLRTKSIFDRLAAVVLAGLGIKLLSSSH